MDVIYGDRQTGKTTKLVLYALENNVKYLITANKICTACAQGIRNKLCSENPKLVVPSSKLEIIDIRSFLNSRKTSSLDFDDKIVVDEAGYVLQSLLTENRASLPMITITTNDDINSVNKNVDLKEETNDD